MFTRVLLGFCLAFSLMVSASFAADPDPRNWDSVLAEAKGETVYFNAWGGAPNINAYIAWVGQQVEARYGVTLEEVKLADTGDAVSRVIAEKAAGRDTGGAVDLIWINGENFAAMKEKGLLLGEPWSESLPNYQYADVENKAVLTRDFTTPVDGLESPWGTAQLTFYYDSAKMSAPPRDLAALAQWIAANPGRFTYAAPPDFIGTTFIKQLALGLFADRDVLYAPALGSEFAQTTAPLWDYLDQIKPNLWRSGLAFPADTARLKNLFADGEIDIGMTFNPGEASSAIKEGLFAETVRSFVLDYGTIANAHFVAIPYNASAKAGAMVVADFLLSPEAQAKKADEAVWGDPTVLGYDKLDAAGKALFDAVKFGPATLRPDEFGKSLGEPDPSWTGMLEQAWMLRYGAGDN